MKTAVLTITSSCGDDITWCYQFHALFNKMSSKFVIWFSKCLKIRTSNEDSTVVSETNGQLRDSVMPASDLQQKVGDETMEDGSLIASQHGLDLGHCDHTCGVVSAGALITAAKPESACNETDLRSYETCLTDESSQSLLHIQTSQNTQSLTTESKASISNAYACDASVNYDVCTDNLSSSSSTLLHSNSDLSSLVSSDYCGLTAGEIAIIENDIELYLNRVCPTTYYDFCLINCEIDNEEATEFRSKFCREYNLMGCMLSDGNFGSLGRDIFVQYEAMMNRSTKVFFYLTENYKKDNVHLRVQNGAVYQQLWEQICKDKDKCVPIFPNGVHRLGLALSGISGLDPTHPELMRRRVLATFTDRVRKVRMLKEAEAKRRRSVFYKELCEYVAQCYKERKDCHHRQGKALSTNTQLALHAEGVRRQELEISPFSNMEVSHVEQELPVEEIVKNIIHKLVSESCENSLVCAGLHSSDIQPYKNNSSSGVHISESSKIHVGPRIEVNVHVNRTREGDSSGSDDDAVELKMM